ncbi:hypothetical protein Hanom_Chr14g01274381 [Helianthus anomalus]
MGEGTVHCCLLVWGAHDFGPPIMKVSQTPVWLAIDPDLTTFVWLAGLQIGSAFQPNKEIMPPPLSNLTMFSGLDKFLIKTTKGLVG